MFEEYQFLHLSHPLKTKYLAEFSEPALIVVMNIYYDYFPMNYVLYIPFKPLSLKCKCFSVGNVIWLLF